MSFDILSLLEVDDAFPALLVGRESALDTQISEIRKKNIPALLINIVRGDRSKNQGALFSEMAASLQFGWYFGRNWDALDDCLYDIDDNWNNDVVIVLTATDRVLKGDRDGFKTLLSILFNAWYQRNHPGLSSGFFPDPPHSLKMLFHCEADSLEITRKRLVEVDVSPRVVDIESN